MHMDLIIILIRKEIKKLVGSPVWLPRKFIVIASKTKKVLPIDTILEFAQEIFVIIVGNFN